jgi:hypothetical protein
MPPVSPALIPAAYPGYRDHANTGTRRLVQFREIDSSSPKCRSKSWPTPEHGCWGKASAILGKLSRGPDGSVIIVGEITHSDEIREGKCLEPLTGSLQSWGL